MHNFTDSDWPEACWQHRLEMESYLIETILARYGAQRIAVTGGQVDQDEVRYQIWLGNETAVFPLRAGQYDLSQQLGVPVKLARHANGLMAHVTKEHPPVSLMGLMRQFGLPPRHTATAVLGLNERGKTINLDCRHDGHVLVAGRQGSGKSTLLQTIALTLALTNSASDVQFLLIQNEGSSDISSLNYLPREYLLHPVISNSNEAVQLLQTLADNVARPVNGRYTPHPYTPHIIIMIDNITPLLAKQGINLLAPLTRLLITHAITVIISTDKPDDHLFTYIGSSIGTRLVGRVNTSAQAQAATGIPFSQAEKLLGHGDFLQIKAANKTPRYFQAAYQDQYDLSFLLLQLRKNQNIPLHTTPMIPKPILSNRIVSHSNH